MTVKELRLILGKPKEIATREFEIVKNMAAIVSRSDHSTVGRELVLRALEHRALFKVGRPILEALTRAIGLFPYIDPEQLDLRDRIAFEFHRPLNMADDFVFHREQAEVYRRLLAGDSVILSAPTSFGKSRIIDAVIATEKFDQVAVIVPTLALIDETRRRLSEFSDRYKIVSHLSQKPHKKNIFIFTAERAVAYKDFPKIQFFVIDEFYKINAFKEDDTRTVALNVAFQRLLRMGGQFFMLGPNVDRIPDGIQDKYRCYFYPTSFTTVVAEHRKIPDGQDEWRRLLTLCKELKDPTLIFCRSPARVNEVADRLLKEGIGRKVDDLANAQEWAARIYHPEWIWGRALDQGIGIHHGRLPRALAQFTVRMFNELKLRFLICTSTLIEGVNTKAKNVVIFDNQIAREQIDFFTFNNIKGRSGRMFEHFIGHVYLFAEPPQESLPFVDFPIFSQDESTPDSLLVHIDNKDLRPSARERMQKWSDQNVLPLEIIRDNATIEPQAQIDLALKIASEAAGASKLLAWHQTPSWDQLQYACKLIWEYLIGVKRSRGGVFSHKQLAFKIRQLHDVPLCADRVQLELVPGQYAARSPDEAVERVLQFERTWAGFEFPRYLMALSRIQEHVLKSLGYSFGDFGHFASAVECLFRNPVVAALDEYGIPTQLAERIQGTLGSEDDLDLALLNLKKADLTKVKLDPFERELLADAQKAL
jgi:hypothetical protein